MYFSEFGGLELHAYHLPPNEIVPLNIQIQFTTNSTELTNAATVLQNCRINKKRKVITIDATFEIYENAKCGNSFDTEIDIHANNNNMIYLISIPDAVDGDFLNSFLSTFIFYSQLPQSLPNISPTPALPSPKRTQPTADLQFPWNIYKNEKFGFSISYPANWRKKEMLSGEYRFNMIRIVELQGAEGDIEIFINTNNDPLECIPGVYNFGRTENWTSIQLYDQKITVCQSNNGLRWKWIFHKTLPTGMLRIVGGTSILRHPNSNDKDIILQTLSTLKFTE
jgi:hypothetical protein